MKSESEKKKTETKKNFIRSHSRSSKAQNQFSAYLKYSALGFQMLAMLGLGVWGGIRLDQYLDFHKPVFLIIFPLLAIVGVLIVTIKGLPKN